MAQVNLMEDVGRSRWQVEVSRVPRVSRVSRVGGV